MDNRRLLLAALLSVGVLVLWQFLFPPPPPTRDRPPGAPEVSSDGGDPVAGPVVVEPASPVPPATTPLFDAPVVAESEETVEVETEHLRVRISNRGGQLVSLRLKKKRDKDGEPLELVRRRISEPYPFSFMRPDGSELNVNRALFAIERRSERDSVVVELRYSGPEGEARKRFRFSDERLFDFEAEARVGEDWGILLGPELRNKSAEALKPGYQGRHRSLSYMAGGELVELLPNKVEGSQSVPGAGVSWIALEDTYFLTMVAPKTPLERIEVHPVLIHPEEGFTHLSDATPEEEDLPIGLSAVLIPRGGPLALASYWGAKEYNVLAAMPFGLEGTVRLGWFGLLARPLLAGLRWTHEHIVDNYGWSIVLMTVFIKIVLFPLTHKSYVSMQRLQKLNPRMESIRHKYRPKLKDKQGRPNLEMQRKMNEEMQRLFREEGVNPASGCLPLLIQMPVFFSFFSILRSSVELWNAPWLLWIQDLSEKDPFYVIPIVMGVTQLLLQRMSPAPPNPSQQMMMRAMPIVFTFFSLSFPSGVVLYWLTNNVLTILQQGGYNRLKKAGYFGGSDPEPPAKKSRGRETAGKKGKGESKGK